VSWCGMLGTVVAMRVGRQNNFFTRKHFLTIFVKKISYFYQKFKQIQNVLILKPRLSLARGNSTVVNYELQT
jgi:hypothetical protein